jgi:hypothetical protein
MVRSGSYPCCQRDSAPTELTPFVSVDSYKDPAPTEPFSQEAARLYSFQHLRLRSPFRPLALSPFRLFVVSLLNHSRLGSPILGPGCIVVAGVCRHLQAEAHGLNPGAGNT